MGRNVNFISWNVKGLNHQVKRNKVLLHLQQLKVGIAFLQETHLLDADCFHIHGKWVGQLFCSCFQGKSRGVAILINKNIPFEPTSITKDNNGRYIITGEIIWCPGCVGQRLCSKLLSFS